MRRIVRTIAAIRFAWSTRRDLLLEVLALRHQLSVLARSNRRLRSADRLVWLILRRVWPRWQDALMLVQPATVDRWQRDGFSRWWPRRTRRPGRPRIDAECRRLIRQMAAENRLWGAPRIHGELVKLGIAVSERTVSRYLRECPRGSSQTWRTFLANHNDQLTYSSPEWPAPGADEVVDDARLTCRQTPLSPDARYRSHQPAVVNCDIPRQRKSSATPLVHDHLHDRSIRINSGRSPPTGPSPADPRRMGSRLMTPNGIDLRTTAPYRSSAVRR